MLGIGDVAGRADDLPATRIVRTGDEREQFLIGDLGDLTSATQARRPPRAGCGWLGISVASPTDAAGTVEQRERQARGQLARLVMRAVVVGSTNSTVPSSSSSSSRLVILASRASV